MAARGTSTVAQRRPASGLKKPPAWRPSARRMTVQEAGRLGGLSGGRKGGLAVKRERGVGFYREIGKLGGQRVRDLIAAGRRVAERAARRRRS